MLRTSCLAVLLFGIAGGDRCRPAFAQESETQLAQRFESPFRLQDRTGEWISGLGAAPFFVDLDGDGDRDLLLGDGPQNSGRLFVCLNAGTDKQPVYEPTTPILAGDQQATVPRGCRIGFYPDCVDWDDDGINDLLSGSTTGHIYLFNGTAPGVFSAGEQLNSNDNVPLLPGVTGVESSASESAPTVFDVDDDGDLDLIVGLDDGRVVLCRNIGTRIAPQFSEEPVGLKMASEPLTVKSSATPRCADWNDDGLWDLLVGCENGSVHCFINSGTAKQHVFERVEELIPGTAKSLVNDDIPDRSQLNAKPYVLDYNNDGLADLLVGDAILKIGSRDDISPEQKRKFRELFDQWDDLNSLPVETRESDAIQAELESLGAQIAELQGPASLSGGVWVYLRKQ